MAAMLTVPATAGDDPPATRDKKNESIKIEIEDDDFIVTSTCEGKEKVVMVNLDAVEGLVNEAIGEVAAALGDLDDMQLQIHLGEDNRLRFADDGSEWEIDLNQVSRQLEAVFETALAGLEDTDWVDHHDRGESELRELRRELDRLRAELKRMERELEQDESDY